MVMKKDTYYNNYLSLWASTAYDEIKNIGTVVNKHELVIQRGYDGFER